MWALDRGNFNMPHAHSGHSRLFAAARNHPLPPVRTSHRLNRQLADAARRADFPDGDAYHRPATDRIAPANLALSVAVLVFALVLASLLLLFIF
jgi:hypothetical protein